MFAHRLRSYLNHLRTDIHAQLLPSDDGRGNTVKFVVDVDLPQRPLETVLAEENVCVTFSDTGDIQPKVLLRESFPSVPHLILHTDTPLKSICLYERPWSEERLNWTPASFVERIRHWLSGTADGTLHREDQPLEPFFFNPPCRLVMPRHSPPPEGAVCWITNYALKFCDNNSTIVLDEIPISGLQNTVLTIPVLFFQGPTVTHGIIHQTPKTLYDLDVIMSQHGLPLLASIEQQLQSYVKQLSDIKSFPLILMLMLPKRRNIKGGVENVECLPFGLAKRTDELFEIFKDHIDNGGILVPKQCVRIKNSEPLHLVPLYPMSIRWHLDSASAAFMNGVLLYNKSIVAIGVGTLGSQTITNLYRGGFGNWILVDNDYFEPHNMARHILGGEKIGQKKVIALAQNLGEIYRPPPQTLDCDYLAPNDKESELKRILGEASFILDFSASVAVQRKLAFDSHGNARRMSVFLNQRGDELVMLVEDNARKTHLLWLEAEYTRAIICDERLDRHYGTVTGTGYRYGGACRELSAIVRQDYVALLSGLAAMKIRKFAETNDACVCISRLNAKTGEVTTVDIGLKQPIEKNVNEWRILLHPDVVAEALRKRKFHQSNETGGVLMGLIDRTNHVIAIIYLLSAPPDSKAWPASFIRGHEGLRNEVEQLQKKTLGTLSYVGEWHSHPSRHGANPSPVDLEAIIGNSIHMEADGIPTLMLIVGARNSHKIVMKPIGENKFIIM